MTPQVVVIGLGPSDSRLVTTGTMERLATAKNLFVRTLRHPAASVLNGLDFVSFDSVYETAHTIEQVYETIVESLVAEALSNGEVCYVVPGSPVVAEHTVELLVDDPRVSVELVPALSFIDLAWVRLGVDPIAQGAQVIDGQSFDEFLVTSGGPFLVSQCDTNAVLSDIKLSVDEPPTEPVVVLYHLGLDDEAVFEVAWTELDRSFEPDHLTSLWIPSLPPSCLWSVAEFTDVVAMLRDECVWDREQTHASLTPYLLEEVYEVLEVLDNVPMADARADQFDDFYRQLEEELGDLLYQIVFHTQIASEDGYFNLGDVASGISRKLKRRNPQIFGNNTELFGGDTAASTEVTAAGLAEVGDATAMSEESDTVEAQEARWELLKQQEKQRASVFDGVVANLPALVLATQIETKAARAGLAPQELTDSTLASRLMALVVEASQAGIDAEAALRQFVRQRESRYRQAEADRERRSDT